MTDLKEIHKYITNPICGECKLQPDDKDALAELEAVESKTKLLEAKRAAASSFLLDVQQDYFKAQVKIRELGEKNHNSAIMYNEFIKELEDENSSLYKACKMTLGFLYMFGDIYISSDKEEAEYRSYVKNLTENIVSIIGKR